MLVWLYILHLIRICSTSLMQVLCSRPPCRQARNAQAWPRSPCRPVKHTNMYMTIQKKYFLTRIHKNIHVTTRTHAHNYQTWAWKLGTKTCKTENFSGTVVAQDKRPMCAQGWPKSHFPAKEFLVGLQAHFAWLSLYMTPARDVGRTTFGWVCSSTW